MKIDYPNGSSLINNSVSIDDGIETIYTEDFRGWINLKNLEIPKSVNKIEKNSFEDCINIHSLTCDPKWFNFIPKNSVMKIVIPNSVKEIIKGQFDDFTSLIYVRLPERIKINDPTIFDSCENLKIIQCEPSIFSKLTAKTIERCISKLKAQYENPVFNFQLDSTKVFNYTGDSGDSNLASSLNLSSSLNITNSFTFSSKNDQKDMTVEELVQIDANSINCYRNGINNVLNMIKSEEIKDFDEPKKTTILDISNICGAVCYKIHKNKMLVPNVVQIYAILRLANEVLNYPESKGSIAEIKPGEGKSLIMAILTIILIKFKRTVDIVTSCLERAKRYKDEQSKYLELFNIEAEVFLNENNSDTNFEDYNQYDFNNNFNVYVFDNPVVYSTIQNLEYYYLHILYYMIPRKSEFDVVLVDVVDNMLADEKDLPLMISNKINYAFSSDIILKVYEARYYNINGILNILNEKIPDLINFDLQEVELLKNAALEAMYKKLNVDYVIKDNKIIIIDHNTDNNMLYTHWPKYVLQMVEIKESLIQTPVSLSFCQINQQAYFKHYRKIAGIIGAFGSNSYEKILKDGYGVNTFKVPCNIPSNVNLFIKERPKSLKEIFDAVIEEIESIVIVNKRPVLVIWDSKKNAGDFKTYYKNTKVNYILDKNKDGRAIKLVVEEKSVTVTISNVIKDINLKVSKISLKKGGLYIIIPMKIASLRLLEQLFDVAGIKGQPGSMVIYKSDEDKYLITSPFNQKNINLDVLQNKFVNYIQNNISWLLSRQKKSDLFDNIMFPFASNYSDILNILSRYIFLIINKQLNNESESNNQSKNEFELIKSVFQNLSYKMVRKAWESFFTKIQNDNLNNNNERHCMNEYNMFIDELNSIISFEKSKDIKCALNCLIGKFIDEKYKDHLFYKKIKISTSNIVQFNLQYTEQSNDVTYLDSVENQEENIVFYKYYYRKVKNALFWVKDKFIENQNRIPGRISLEKTPKIEMSTDYIKSKNIIDIHFIKRLLKFAKEAYDGNFEFGRVIFESTTNELYKPIFYCIEYLNILYVVVRGSASDCDWMTDFTCDEIFEKINGINIYFHKGFFNAALYIFENIEKYLIKNYDEVYFVGHSYGAAVSNILCFLTKTNPSFKNNNIFSFAFAPPPSMSKTTSFPAYVQDCMFSFINKTDIVPHISMNNIKQTISFKETSFKAYIESSLKYIKALKYASKYAQKMADFIEKYKQNIFSVLDSDNKELHVHTNFGNIYLITNSPSVILNDYKINETKHDVLYFVPSMFSDHLIEEYIRSFEKISSYY